MSSGASIPATRSFAPAPLPDGIGMVYPDRVAEGLPHGGHRVVAGALRRCELSTECEVVFVVTIPPGAEGGTVVSPPLPQAMVDASDVMIGIGGGAIARDELEEVRAEGQDGALPQGRDEPCAGGREVREGSANHRRTRRRRGAVTVPDQ